MKKELFISFTLIFCLIAGPALADDHAPPQEITDLTPWKGYSVSIKNLYTGEDGDKFFKAVTEHAPKGYTLEKVRKFFLDMFTLKFNSMEVIDGDTITIDGKITGDYIHVGSFKTKWGEHNVTWDIFKTGSEEMIQAGYKYFLLIPFHQHGEEGLRHAHFRYGNANFDFLATDPSLQLWWPTIYQPYSTDEKKIMENMIKGAKLQATILPKLN